MQENLPRLKRVELLSRIEDGLSRLLERRVAVAAYVANTADPTVAASTAMSSTQLSFVDDIIRTAGDADADSVALILESFGGEATFPLEVVDRAKKYYRGFYVVVANVAKSAATLLSLISDGILALETASFGPVDPQLVIPLPQGPQLVSARQIKELIEVTLPNVMRNVGPAERAAILASQNYLLYQQALDGLKFVKEVLDTHLKPGFPEGRIAEVKKRLVDDPMLHDVKVTPKDLRDLGFDVVELRVNEDPGSSLVEYHRRALRNLLAEAPPNSKGLILLENRKVSYQLAGQVMIQQPTARTSLG